MEEWVKTRGPALLFYISIERMIVMTVVVRSVKGYQCHAIYMKAYRRWKNVLKCAFYDQSIELDNGDVFLFKIDDSPCLHRLPCGAIANCGNALRGIRCDRFFDSPDEFEKFLSEEYRIDAVST